MFWTPVGQDGFVIIVYFVYYSGSLLRRLLLAPQADRAPSKGNPFKYISNKWNFEEGT